MQSANKLDGEALKAVNDGLEAAYKAVANDESYRPQEYMDALRVVQVAVRSR